MKFPEMLKEFTAAVEAGDGTRLGALFTEDGVYHDTFYGAFQGREAIREMLEEYFYRDGTRFRWDMSDPVCNENTGYALWRFSYASVLPDLQGQRAAVTGMSQFQLNNGLIAHYSEVFDSGKAMAQLGFAPERIVKLLNRWNTEELAHPNMARHIAD